MWAVGSARARTTGPDTYPRSEPGLCRRRARCLRRGDHTAENISDLTCKQRCVHAARRPAGRSITIDRRRETK